MKAIVYEKYGGPSVLQEKEIPKPTAEECGDDKVIVQIYSSAMNPIDWKLAKGLAKLIMKAPSKENPTRLGKDFSGIITHSGKNVKNFKVGDEVFGVISGGAGSFAEYVIVPEAILAKKPKNMSHNEAASVPLAAQTSYESLFLHGKLPSEPVTSGEKPKVLIIGGSGGTGMFGIQLAHYIGAHVTTICSGKNEEFVKKLGADQVVDYHKEDFAVALKDEKFDLVYDCVGGYEYYEKSQNLLKSSGMFVTIIGDEHVDQIGITSLIKQLSSSTWRKFCSLFGSPGYSTCLLKGGGKDLAKIGKIIEENKLVTSIDTVYTFDQFHDCVQKSMSGRTQGKLVIDMKV